MLLVTIDCDSCSLICPYSLSHPIMLCFCWYASAALDADYIVMLILILMHVWWLNWPTALSYCCMFLFSPLPFSASAVLCLTALILFPVIWFPPACFLLCLLSLLLLTPVLPLWIAASLCLSAICSACCLPPCLSVFCPASCCILLSFLCCWLCLACVRCLCLLALIWHALAAATCCVPFCCILPCHRSILCCCCTCCSHNVLLVCCSALLACLFFLWKPALVSWFCWLWCLLFAPSLIWLCFSCCLPLLLCTLWPFCLLLLLSAVPHAIYVPAILAWRGVWLHCMLPCADPDFLTYES